AGFTPPGCAPVDSILADDPGSDIHYWTNLVATRPLHSWRIIEALDAEKSSGIGGFDADISDAGRSRERAPNSVRQIRRLLHLVKPAAPLPFEVEHIGAHGGVRDQDRHA